MSNSFRQNVKKQLAQANLHRLESLGQNFLIDETIITRICQAVTVDHPDLVLEIGPGLGSVTFPLAVEVKRLIAVELDRGLARALAVAVPAGVKIIQGDILKQDLTTLGLVARKYVVFGSLPFNLGTAIIRFLLESQVPPRVIYAILQQEVVDRILAKNKAESVLSLAVKFYGQAKSVFSISRQAYQPQPRVNTALLKINCVRQFPPRLEKPFFRLIKAGFAHKRKYVCSNLIKNLGLTRNVVENALTERKLRLTRRAETLSFADWLYLAEKLSKFL